MDRVPVGLSVRYGQDIAICDSGTTTAQCRSWDRQRLWSCHRYVSVALATHIRAHHCEDIRELLINDVQESVRTAGWTVYNSWNPDVREEIPDLAQYPCRDPSGHENRIYNEHGARIPRIEFMMDPDNLRNAGVLIDLRDISSLFDQGTGTTSAVVTVFPQAFINRIGHVKSTKVLRSFEALIEQRNTIISAMWDEDEAPQLNKPSAVVAGGCQFYNELSHRVARRAGTQEVQTGDQTSAMASGYPHQSTTSSRRADVLFAQCEANLPYKRHFLLLDDHFGNAPTDLRAENVFILDLFAFPPEMRTGQYVTSIYE